MAWRFAEDSLTTPPFEFPVLIAFAGLPMIQSISPPDCAQILLQSGDRTTSQQYDLPVVIGCGTGADIRISDNFASEFHCVIRKQDGMIVLQDQYSDWGTFVNGERVQEKEISPGDRIAAGLSVFEVA